MERFKFTPKNIAKAQELYDEGLTWPQVAKELGCKLNSLKVTLTKRKKGRYSGKSEDWEKTRASVASLIDAKNTPREIAEALNKSRGAIYVLLYRMGYRKQQGYSKQ